MTCSPRCLAAAVVAVIIALMVVFFRANTIFGGLL